MAERLALVPGEFAEARLEARADIHPAQITIAEALDRNIFQSAALTGRNKSGKTHFFYALYRRVAVEAERRVYGSKLKRWLDEIRKQLLGEPGRDGQAFNCQLTACTLSHARRATVFLEELDKVKPTEFAAAELFDLIDTIYERRFQLVVTSNLALEQLADYWSSPDVLGASIARRIMDICTEYEFA